MRPAIVRAVGLVIAARPEWWARSRAVGYGAIGFASLLLVLGAAALAIAGGSVTGVVKDALGRPLGGAAVRLEAADGRVIGRTTADEAGRFTYADVPAGTYAVVAERGGFEPSMAIATVSKSRISPTRTISGSSRKAARKAREKDCVCLCTSRWLTRQRCCGCTNSTGSSTVRI